MSLLVDHGDENRDERGCTDGLGLALALTPTAAPRLVLGTDRNNKDNSNYSYSVEPGSRAKLSPISASGVFSKYNVFSPLDHRNSNSSKQGSGSSRVQRPVGPSQAVEEEKRTEEQCRAVVVCESSSSSSSTEEKETDEDPAAPFKRFKNPFASPVVSSFGTLELSGVTKGSFTTMSISTIGDGDVGRNADADVVNTTTATEDSQLDCILRLAKKMMGDELVEDLIAVSSSPAATARRRFCFPATGAAGQLRNDKIETVGEFVDTVIEKELTLCSWTCQLAITQDLHDLDSLADTSSVQFSFASDVSTGTVVRHTLLRHHQQPCLVQTPRARRRDWFLRLFHWHSHRRPICSPISCITDSQT